MTDAWIVIYDNYNETWISGVFSTEEKAQAYMDAKDPPTQRRYSWDKDYRLEHFKLDEYEDQPL